MRAVSRHLTQFDINVRGDDVVVTPGCKQALLYGMMAVMAPGDEVLLLSPAWPSYDGMIRLTGPRPFTFRFVVKTTTPISRRLRST